MAKITVTPQALVVSLSQYERVAGLLPNLEIPLAHVRGATHDDGIRRDLGMRAPGLAVPRRTLIGTFRKWKHKDYVVWRNEPEIMVVQLVDERWDRLVIGVHDAESRVQEINALTA